MQGISKTLFVEHAMSVPDSRLAARCLLDGEA